MVDSYYYPCVRSAAWKDLQTATIPTSIPAVNPERHYPKETLRMVYPFKLDTGKCPVNEKTAASWTERERDKADKAPKIENVEDLRKYVSITSYAHVIVYSQIL
jgi:hypothetical protein